VTISKMGVSPDYRQFSLAEMGVGPDYRRFGSA